MEEKHVIGTHGYIDGTKNSCRRSMVIYFVFAIALISIPYIITRNLFNPFAIAGVVMLLPAYQSMKKYSELKPYSSCNPEYYAHCSEIVKDKLWMVLLSDLVLYGTQRKYGLDLAIIYNDNIYAYTSDSSINIEELEGDLTSLLEAIEIKNKKPIVHQSFDDFEDMLQMLAANETDHTQGIGAIYHQIQSNCI